MTDKEVIKKEIERRYNCEKCYPLDREANIAAAVLQELLLFIESLPEEPFDYTNVNIIPKDFGELPQTIEQAAVQAHIELEECNGLSFVNTFSKGAEWQKHQMKEALQTEYEKGRFDMREEMMKGAVEGVVHHFADDELAAVHYNDPKDTPMSIYVSSKGLSAGDKVKIIIVKTEQQ